MMAGPYTVPVPSLLICKDKAAAFAGGGGGGEGAALEGWNDLTDASAQSRLSGRICLRERWCTSALHWLPGPA